MHPGLGTKLLAYGAGAIEDAINSTCVMGAILLLVQALETLRCLAARAMYVGGMLGWAGPSSRRCIGYTTRSRLGVFKGMSVAFICDGNRRYVRKHGMKDDFTRDEGIRKIYEFIDFGYRYGLKEVSFFCLALNNLRRAPEEVRGLMRIVTHKVQSPKDMDIRPRFRIYGRMELLEEDVRNRLASIEEESKNNTDIVVNIFFAYSAEDEINRGVLFDSHVDVLVRTGEVRRLSNFMIRQVAKGTSLFFAKALWPELTTAHLFLILLKHKLETKYLLN